MRPRVLRAVDPAVLEAALRARLGFALDERLRALSVEFGGLLDRPALVLLVADEERLLPPPEGAPDAPSSPPRDLLGRVERLTSTRAFRRQDGSTGFVCDADVRTPMGLERVVLWDEAVRAIQGSVGRDVRLTALLAKDRGPGRELHSTRATRVEPR